MLKYVEEEEDDDEAAGAHVCYAKETYHMAKETYLAGLRVSTVLQTSVCAHVFFRPHGWSKGHREGGKREKRVRERRVRERRVRELWRRLEKFLF